eukprot:TRINITY_DN1363_c0_g1_i3.p1 TRINITY_DN1363_c0_g1~~TRINITY_DN1363_c0_g1_i3.p1  ORF type:complete len:742 (-),score=165.93 TRINITY_DN1363_c0_g1_i3:59-2284(-)
MSLELESIDSILSKLDPGYLQEIALFSFSRLEREPRQLLLEEATLENDSQDVAINHYRTFVDTASCIKQLSSSIKAMQDSVETVLTQVPSFTDSCQHFLQQAQDIRSKHKLNRRIIDNQMQLVELLELPQVMDTCVRNNLYEEALNLLAYTRTLQQRHAHIPILKLLVEEMEVVSQNLLSVILNQLHSNIQLPTCLRLVAYLRRFAPFSEHELRCEFLKRREVWLDEQLADLAGTLQTSSSSSTPSSSSSSTSATSSSSSSSSSSSAAPPSFCFPLSSALLDHFSQVNGSAYSFLTKYLDINRIYLFDIITQYEAIFGFAETSVGQEAKEYKASDVVDGGSGGGECSVLYSWLLVRVSQILSILQTVLPVVRDGSFVSNLLEQSCYCALSLGRVRLDFRGLVATLFEHHLVQVFSDNMADAFLRFVQSFQIHDWYIEAELLTKMGIDVSAAGLVVTGGVEDGVSMKLLEYPPLAVFSNALIGAFNHLRLCAPRLSQRVIASLVEQTCRLVSHHMHTLYQEEATTPNRISDKQKLLSAMAKATVDHLIPFICLCVNSIYQNVELLKVETLVADYSDLLIREPSAPVTPAALVAEIFSLTPTIGPNPLASLSPQSPLSPLSPLSPPTTRTFSSSSSPLSATSPVSTSVNFTSSSPFAAALTSPTSGSSHAHSPSSTTTFATALTSPTSVSSHSPSATSTLASATATPLSPTSSPAPTVVRQGSSGGPVSIPFHLRSFPARSNT